jgi:hypothetical protein
MKFLDTPIRKREFVAKREGNKEYPEAKQPPLQAEKFSGATYRPQLEISGGSAEGATLSL